MKKPFLFLAIAVVLSLASCSGETVGGGVAGTDAQKPLIVDFFACDEDCTGPREWYMVQVYEGVDGEQECRDIGGIPRMLDFDPAKRYCQVVTDPLEFTIDE